MKRYLTTFAIFCLWAIAFYFFSQIIFTYTGYMLQLQNKFLDFISNNIVVISLILAAMITGFGFYKKWSDKNQFISIEALLRYFLGFSLLTYGLTKIFQTQFVLLPFAAWQLPLERLGGDHLTWAFLGKTSWFQVLLGFFEFIPAILVLFRRTVLLGAILLLPMTLNVLLINHALDLWSGTKELSIQFFAMNLIILMFYWKRIRDILFIIVGRGVKLKYFKWELVAILSIMIIYLYPFTKMLLDYKNQKNVLVGDWFNGHPNEWVLETEKINDSTLDHRVLKSYFGVYGSYSEINDSGFVFNGINYELDEKKNTLSMNHNGNISHFTFKIVNDTLLETEKIIDSARNIKLTQVFKRRIINKERPK